MWELQAFSKFSEHLWKCLITANSEMTSKLIIILSRNILEDIESIEDERFGRVVLFAYNSYKSLPNITRHRSTCDLIVICKEGFVDELLHKDANYHQYAFKIPVYGKT